MHPDITWKQTVVMDIGGNPTTLMVCAHGESYTRAEWAALTDDERAAARARHDSFHKLLRGAPFPGVLVKRSD